MICCVLVVSFLIKLIIQEAHLLCSQTFAGLLRFLFRSVKIYNSVEIVTGFQGGYCADPQHGASVNMTNQQQGRVGKGVVFKTTLIT